MEMKIGIVRIFDDDKGVGFIAEITAGGDRPTFGPDFFVHESTLRTFMPTLSRKKKLITGEYVEFQVDERHNPRSTQKKRVKTVRGLYGGPLMFEQGAHAKGVFAFFWR